MNKSRLLLAGLTMACSSAVFAQAQPIASDHSNGLSTANGSIDQPETAGTVHSTTNGDVTYNPANPSSVATPRKKQWMPSGTHATNDTVTTGTPAQPAGNDTGMAGSGPGVPANANGMGTTPR